MESLTQPEILLKPFADDGDKNAIPVTNTDAENPQKADLTNGFPEITSEDPDDGGLPPERKDFNGLGYLTTTYDYFYQAGGTFTFSTTISSAIGGYPLGARLWYTDSNGATTVVRSTVENNTDNFNDGSATGIGTTWVPEIPALGWNNVWTGNNTFSTPNGLQTQTPLILKESDGTVEGGQIEFESGDTEPNTGKKIYLDRYNGTLRVWGVRSDNTTVQPFMADVQSDKITLSANAQKNLNFQLMPKYSSATPISSGYFATSNGYFEGVVDSTNNYSIVIDGVTLVSRGYSNTQVAFPFSIPVGIGSTITFSSVVNPLFIPCVGG